MIIIQIQVKKILINQLVYLLLKIVMIKINVWLLIIINKILTNLQNKKIKQNKNEYIYIHVHIYVQRITDIVIN